MVAGPDGQPAGVAADDASLLARVAGGDREALEMLYRRHGSWITARLQSRCGDAELTDLAVQDTFLVVWRSARKYRGDGEVGAWLWGIAIRRLIDQLRRRRSTPLDPARIVARLEHGATSPTHAAHEPPFGADVEALVVGTSSDRLDQAMYALAPELRAVLVATAIDGLTTKEAARLLGVPQGTVKTRLMRARRQLQEALA